MSQGKVRIAVGQLMAETVTFLPADTVREDFYYEGSPLTGEQLLRTRHGYIGGFRRAVLEYEGVELTGLTSPQLPKGSSGWITTDAYEWFVARMLEDLEAAGKVDGVYLSLHGAMAVRGVERPEADVARRVREVVGPLAYIAATFDPHGNEDAAFLEFADFAFCAKYFPHYDEYLQGERAARALVRAIRGDFRPSSATCKVPILTPTVQQWTGASPWSDLVQRALTWEAANPDLYMNIFFGFPWSDVVDSGMTVQATTNDDLALARCAVEDVAGFAWASRARLVNAARVFKMRDGVAHAAALADDGRVVLADHSDRSGRATWLLAELIEQNVSRTLVATIADPTLVRTLADRNVAAGDQFDLAIGGSPEEADGPAVRVTGRVRGVIPTDAPSPQWKASAEAAGAAGAACLVGADNSPWVLLEFGEGNVLVVTPLLTQIIDPGILTDELGLDLRAFSIIALKSRAHFRRGFTDSGVADHVVIVEPASPFLGTTRLDALQYRQLEIADYYPYGREHFTPNTALSVGTEPRGD